MDKELLKDQIQTLAFLKYVDAKDHDWLLNELVEGIIDSRIFSFPSGENYTNLDGLRFLLMIHNSK